MTVAEDWGHVLTRWTDAGLIDDVAAARIREFEQTRTASARWRWPMWVAMAFGALMLGAGVLLFVSAHWDMLSPNARFALVLLLVATFHAAAAACAERFPAMATTLHALGTVALGAGIYLAGQVFNLDEHWPGGVMLWAFGAAIGWALLRDWPQLALLAWLTPAWLNAEWYVATEPAHAVMAWRVDACGTFLIAIAYFTAIAPARDEQRRRVLLWLGAITLLPAAAFLAFTASDEWLYVTRSAIAIPFSVLALGWTVAIGLPLILAIALRRADAWPQTLATIWVVTLVNLYPMLGSLSLYVWWALGAIGLAAWGVREARTERINMACVILTATVVTFYFSQVMDKLGRSASLVGFGLLFLGGGWAIERLRRRLIQQTRGADK